MKSFSALLITLSMVLSLVACSGNEQSTPDTNLPISSPGTSSSGGVSDPTDSTEDTTGTTLPPLTTTPTVESETKPTVGSSTTTPVSSNKGHSSLEQLKDLVTEISGRWYLEGYADVYLDIKYEPNNIIDTSFMYIVTNNFSIRDKTIIQSESGFLNEYSVYPHIQYPNASGWSCGISCWLYQWDSDIAKANFKIESDCIYIDTYKFVRTQGVKNQHSEFGVLGDGMEHDYEAKVIDATPTAQGYILYTCKVCGHSYKGTPPYYGIVNGVALKVADTNVAYCVIGITNDAPVDIIIPDTYAGLPVVSIDELSLRYGIPEVAKGDPSILKSISIPKNIKNIDKYAFEYCTNLTTIRYQGTVNQWKGITLGTQWNYYFPATNVICTDGMVPLESTVRVSGVQISKTTLSLNIGDTQQLTATVLPSNADNKNVTWFSSNSSIVQVSSSGKITAKGEGSAVITVTTKDGGYTASCNVTISAVHVNGISLNQTALNMTVGDTQQLTATVSPSNANNKNVTWSSSNSSVAQVSSGKITAKGKGSAIITVTTVDGNYSTICTVTVTEPALTVDASISVSYIAGSSGFVRAVSVSTVASGGSGNFVEYYMKVYHNGNLVAEGAKKEMLVTLANGTYTAEVYVKDSSGNEVTTTKSMSISGF